MTPRPLTSRLLPVLHGFSTREGGVSEGPYASLNVGFSVGDARERVEANLARVAAAEGVALGRLGCASQVHGDRVLEAGPGTDAPGVPGELGEADALFTGAPGAWVGVRTADCVPVLLVDPDGHQVAAVHSGWKGTDLRIAARAVEALVARGARPERLLAAVGPSIRACCYEVSPELGARFTAAFGEGVAVARGEGGRPHLDLAEALRRTLRAAGLRDGHVDVLPDCTACDAGRFFSHRRDAGRTGRHLNYVIHRF